MPLTPAQRKALQEDGYSPDWFENNQPQQQYTPALLGGDNQRIPESSQSSVMGATTRSAAANALPTMASGAGLGAGMVLGNTVAAGLVGLGALESGTGVGALIGIPTGLVGAYMLSKLAAKKQQQVMPESWNKQLAIDAAQHPYATAGGALLDLPLGGFSLSAPNALNAVGTLARLTTGVRVAAPEIQNLINVGSGAVLNPAISAGTAAITGEPMPSAGELGKEALVGALFNRPNIIGQGFGFHPPLTTQVESKVPLAPDMRVLPSNAPAPIPPSIPNSPYGMAAMGDVGLQPPAINPMERLAAAMKIGGAMEKELGPGQKKEIVAGLVNKDNIQQAQDIVDKNIAAAKQAQPVAEPVKRSAQQAPVELAKPLPEDAIALERLNQQIADAQKLADDPHLPVATKVAAQEQLTLLRQRIANLPVVAPQAGEGGLIVPSDERRINKTYEDTSKEPTKTTTGMLSTTVPAETAITKAMQGTSKYQEAGQGIEETVREQKKGKEKKEKQLAPISYAPKQEAPVLFPKAQVSLGTPVARARQQGLAAQHGVEHVIDPNLPDTVNGQIFKENAQDTLSHLNPRTAGGDTPAHETLHALYAYMKTSNDKFFRNLTERADALFGGEEPFVQMAGERGYAKFNQDRTWANRVKEWYGDFKSQWKYKLGKANAEDMANIMSYYLIHDIGTKERIGGSQFSGKSINQENDISPKNFTEKLREAELDRISKELRDSRIMPSRGFRNSVEVASSGTGRMADPYKDIKRIPNNSDELTDRQKDLIDRWHFLANQIDIEGLTGAHPGAFYEEPGNPKYQSSDKGIPEEVPIAPKYNMGSVTGASSQEAGSNPRAGTPLISFSDFDAKDRFIAKVYHALNNEAKAKEFLKAMNIEETPEELSGRRMPTNMGGSESSLSAEQQRQSRENNSRAAFERLAREQGTQLPPAATREQSSDKGIDERSRIFGTQLEKDLTTDKPFGIVPAKDRTIATGTLISKMNNNIPKGELEMLREQGMDDYLKGKQRINADEFAKWVQDNGPRVEVRKFQYGKGTEQRQHIIEVERRMNAAQHQLETQGWSTTDTGLRKNNNIFVAQGDQVYEYNPSHEMVSQKPITSFDQKVQDYFNARHEFEGIAIRDTPGEDTHWSTIAPKAESEMPGYVEIAVTHGAPIKDRTHPDVRQAILEDEPNIEGARGIKFPSTHSFPPNTLGWVRGYMETTPRRELKAAVRFPNGEIQGARPNESTHAQIYNRLLEEDHPNLLRVGDPDVESGWVTEDGKTFVTNDEVQKETKYKPDTFGSGGISVPGRKVFRIIEVQSDWGARMKEVLQRMDEGWKNTQYPEQQERADRNFLSQAKDPRLEHYESLALKAAIDHAVKEGADAIAVDDAQTAMLTEGHDRARETIDVVDHARTRQEGERKLKHYQERNPDSRYTLSDDGQTGEKWVIREVEKEISQAKGMTAAYDVRLPNILRKLTGEAGQKMEFGEHKMAFEQHPNDFAPNQQQWQGMLERGEITQDQYNARVERGININQGKPRKDLIFKNPDGTPKTTSTAHVFPLDTVAPRIKSSEPMQQFSSRYQLSDKGIVETPEFKNWFGNSKVVDENGKPLVVYHGTSGEHNEFKPSKLGSILKTPIRRFGTFLTASLPDADIYSRVAARGSYGTPRIIDSYVKIESPYKMSEQEFNEFMDWGRMPNQKYKTREQATKAANDKLKDIKAAGHDGIIIGDDAGKEYVVFNSNQIKSATGNKGTFDPNNPDIRYQQSNKGIVETAPTKQSTQTKQGDYHTSSPSIKIPFLRPEIDKIRDKSPIVADAFTKFYDDFDNLRGYLTNDIVGKLKGFLNYWNLKEYGVQNNEKLNRARQYMDDVADGKKPTITLTPEEQQIVSVIKENNARTLELKNERPTLRNTEADEDYFQNVVSRKVIDTLLNHPSSPEAAKLIEDFYKFQKEKGATPEESRKELRDFKLGYQSSDKNLAAQFGPIDKPAGKGIPQSWREKNLIDRMARYNNRYARRIAYEDAVKSRPEVMDALTNPETGVINSEPVKNVLRDIGGQQEQIEATRSAVGGVIRAGMMGPLTGAKDFVSNFSLGLQHQTPRQAIPAMVYALVNLKKGVREAFETGRNRHNIGSLEVGDEGMRGFQQLLHRVRDVMNDQQGRNFLERVTRGVAMGEGSWLGMDNIYNASKGRLSTQGKAFLDNFAGPEKWEQYKTKGEFPPAVLKRVAARYVDSVQGSYNYRGLPSLTQRGSLAPVLSLARWNVEKMNNFNKYVITPAIRDNNYTPLLMSTVGMLIGGAAVTKLVEVVTGRKERTPKVEELIAANKAGHDVTGGILYKGAALASLSGYAGLAGDITKSAMDVYNKNRPSVAYENPLISGALEGEQYLEDIMAAMKNHDTIRVMDGISNFLSSYFQAYRVAQAQLGPETQQEIADANKRRDLKVFNQLSGYPVPEVGRDLPNDFLNKQARDFKKSQNLQEAAGILPSLIEQEWNNSHGNMMEFRKRLQALKQNSYQTIPNPQEDMPKFVKYFQYVRETQGEEAAQSLWADYLKRNTLNKVKSSLIPTL